MIFCLFVNESNHLFIDSRTDHFLFGFYQKNNQIEIKKKTNRTETGSNRPVSVRFDFFGLKPVWLDFFWFG
jgi:hypothetical protein